MMIFDRHWSLIYIFLQWSTCWGTHHEISLPFLPLQPLGKLFGDGPAVPHRDGNTVRIGQCVPWDIMGPSKMGGCWKPGTRVNWPVPTCWAMSFLSLERCGLGVSVTETQAGVASELRAAVFDIRVIRFVDWGMPLQSASLSQAGPTMFQWWVFDFVSSCNRSVFHHERFTAMGHVCFPQGRTASPLWELFHNLRSTRHCTMFTECDPSRVLLGQFLSRFFIWFAKWWAERTSATLGEF